MPFKSEAQRLKFYELEKQGKISKKTVAEWEKATPKGKLPERIGPENPVHRWAHLNPRAKK